jgi:uncharacterized protein YunC (DUF1805 family)
VIFARTGANDPNFNLMSEPMMIVRRKSENELFASVIEPHGYFNEAEERSLEATPSIQGVRTVADSDEGTVIEVTGKAGLSWTIMVANGAASSTATHRVSANGRTFNWTGNYRVEGVKPR